MAKTDLETIIASTLLNHKDEIMKGIAEGNAILKKFSHAGRMDRLAEKFGISIGNLYDLVGLFYGSKEMEEALQKLEGPHGKTLLRAMQVRWKDRGHGG